MAVLFIVGVVAGLLCFVVSLTDTQRTRINKNFGMLKSQSPNKTLEIRSAMQLTKELEKDRKAEEKERQKDLEIEEQKELLKAELRRLNLQLDYYNDLEVMQNLDFDWYKRTNNERAYKQALQLITKIHNLQKKIDVIENKLEKLNRL